ncbi:MAG TPA: hypothetical protein VIX87_04140 [Steroidobacteraceae bacterium]
MKNANPDKPQGTGPPVGKVRHDERGHAVWQWAADTARSMIVSTSQVLRRLDNPDLALKDEPPAAKPGTAAPPKASRTPAPKPTAGSTPYAGRRESRGGSRASAPRSVPTGTSWWRRLFRR